jgi:hypothetical protein
MFLNYSLNLLANVQVIVTLGETRLKLPCTSMLRSSLSDWLTLKTLLIRLCVTSLRCVLRHTHTYLLHAYLLSPGNTNWRGKFRTIHLLVLTSLDHMLLILKTLFFAKQRTLKRRSTVLSLPFQLVLPALTFLKYVPNTPFPHFCAIFSLSLLHTPDTSTRWLLTHPSMGVLRKDTPWRDLYRKDLSPK